MHFLICFPNRFKYSQGISWPHRRFLSFKSNKGSLLVEVLFGQFWFQTQNLHCVFVFSVKTISILVPSCCLHGDQDSPTASAWEGPRRMHSCRCVCGMKNEGCAGDVRRASKARETPLHAMSDFSVCLPFASAADQGAEKSSQKISCNLGNIAECPASHLIMWLKGTFYLEICNFLVLYWPYTITFPVVYHTVEYQDKFTSPYIYHITGGI